MEEEKQREPINGWLKFFLIVGIGLGMLVSTVLNLVALKDVVAIPALAFLVLLDLIIQLVTGVMTIVAFYRRRPNAVYLAMTYLVIVFVESMILVVNPSLAEDGNELRRAIRSAGWSIVWFVYLIRSKQVARVIPVETRCWLLPEKLLAGGYAATIIAVWVVSSSVATNIFTSPYLSLERKMNYVVNGFMESLPTEEEEGGALIWESVAVEGKTVFYYHRYAHLLHEDMDPVALKQIEIFKQQEYLKRYIGETDPDIIPLYDLYFQNGYTLCHCYLDSVSEVVSQAVITADEYLRAKSQGVENFHCGDSIWQAYLEVSNQVLPADYWEDGILNSLSLDASGNALQFNVQLPLQDKDQVSVEALEQFAKDNFAQNIDYTVLLAEMDRKDIVYNITSASGMRNWVVTIPYSEYVQLMAE